MSLDLQLQVLWNNPKLSVAGVVVLSIIAQTLYTKWKRAWEGRVPMVSYFIPWIGSGLEIGRNPNAFFNRTKYAFQRSTRDYVH